MKTSATKTNQRRPFSTDEMKAIYELSINVLAVIMVVAFCGCMITSDIVNKLHLSTLYSISDWVIVISVILLALLGKPICQLLILRRDFDLIDHLGSIFDPMLKKAMEIKESNMWTLVVCSSIVISIVTVGAAYYYFGLPWWHEVKGDLEWIVRNRQIARILWYSSRALAIIAVWNWAYAILRRTNLD